MVLNLHTPLDLWYLHDVSVNELPAALNTTLQFIDILKILGWLVSFGEYRYINCMFIVAIFVPDASNNPLLRYCQ